MPRAINMISGPSRTGDIEQTIVLGRARAVPRSRLCSCPDVAIERQSTDGAASAAAKAACGSAIPTC